MKTNINMKSQNLQYTDKVDYVLSTGNENFYEIDKVEIEKFYKNKKPYFIYDHADQFEERYFCDENGKLRWVVGNGYFQIYHNETDELIHEVSFNFILDMLTFEKDDFGYRCDSYYSENGSVVSDKEILEKIINFEPNDRPILNLNYKYRSLLNHKFK